MELKDKKATVVGLARSGVGAANLLASLGASVVVTDMRSESELAAATARLDPSVKRALGGHPEELFMSADLLVVSPGVPLDIAPIRTARSNGIPVISELELAFQVLSGSRQDSRDAIQFLAVTGSNGKSTTTTLLDDMLRRGGACTVLGGNIGNALTEEILKMREDRDTSEGKYKNEKGKYKNKSGRACSEKDFVVAEVSSFQLEAIDAFRPRIASILNITPDHMDRYHSLQEYAAAKAGIFLKQGEGDFLVINADDPETVRTVDEFLSGRRDKPELYYFSRTKAVRGVYCKDGALWCDMPHMQDYAGTIRLAAAGDILIKGVHNLENAMAASVMALLAKCPLSAVTESMKTFPGLEHRLEFVRELDGVRYVNDSKGTNVGAVEKSIESFTEPLILIAGGRDKAGDFAKLRKQVAERVKALVLIGEASGKINDAVGDVTDTSFAGTLQEAVEISRSKAVKGDAVLLSPACASFDMFLDFEDRGRQFKKIVMGFGKK